MVGDGEMPNQRGGEPPSFMSSIYDNRGGNMGDLKPKNSAPTSYFNCKFKFPIMDSDISSHQNPSF